jgi:hypothetical protein
LKKAAATANHDSKRLDDQKFGIHDIGTHDGAPFLVR